MGKIWGGRAHRGSRSHCARAADRAPYRARVSVRTVPADGFHPMRYLLNVSMCL